MIRESIEKLAKGMHLTSSEAGAIMKEIMSGSATEAQIGAFLTALRIKGETAQEISAFAAVMKEFCNRIHPKVKGRLVDIVGTGGDRVKTFNISTASAFIVAGAGIAVAKHGNRAVTSKSGSADVLERLGLNLALEPRAVERIIEEVGIGFMFAPTFHPAMKYALGPRREIGIRTIFNILGPLTNPADADAQVVGVYTGELLETVAQALKELGCEEAMVVYGVDGVDEISITGNTSIAWLRNGGITFKEISPKDFGFRRARTEEIEGTTPEESADLIFRLLNNLLAPQDPRRNMVILNAAAGMVVGGKADALSDGIGLAIESIQSGAAYKKLRTMIKASGVELKMIEELERRYA